MKPYSIIKVSARMHNGERIPPTSLVGGVVIEQFDDRNECKRRAAELRASHPSYYYYPQFNYAAVQDVKSTTRTVDITEKKPARKTKKRAGNIVPMPTAKRGIK